MAGVEGALGGNKEAGFDYDNKQNSRLSKDAVNDKSRDDLEEEKDKSKIENNQIFSNGSNPGPKKNSQKILEFFKNLKSSNNYQKTSI